METDPVWVQGIGWASDSPSLETRDWVTPAYARLAAEMAYRLAKVRDPARSFDLAEVDDKFSYKELQHLEALRLTRKGQAGEKGPPGGPRAGGRSPTNT